jgi:hypothetical protein
MNVLYFDQRRVAGWLTALSCQFQYQQACHCRLLTIQTADCVLYDDLSMVQVNKTILNKINNKHLLSRL